MTRPTGPLILGASSRVGRMLYHLWQAGLLDFGGAPVWQYRRDQPGQAAHKLIWDMVSDPLPAMAPSGVICLAGATAGPDLDLSPDLARAALRIAQGAPLLYASSQAVYGPQPGLLNESSPCHPGAYGAAKLAAEAVLLGHPNATCLRIANVIGADAVLINAAKGPVTLDRFPGGQSPRRMMIGPLALGRVLAALLAKDQIAPAVVNIAQPGAVAMADLLAATGQDWTWRPAPDTAIPQLELDLRVMQSLINDIPVADPVALVAEARQAGWRI